MYSFTFECSNDEGFTQFLMSFLKPQGQSFSKFASLLSVMKDKSSAFRSNLIYFRQEYAIKLKFLEF